MDDIIKEFQVPPSDNIFTVIGDFGQQFEGSLAELIDNSIAARIDDHVNVWITYYFSLLNPTLSYMDVDDDASGIHLDLIPRAIAPAAMAGASINSLNRHGMGMKHAIPSIGELDYLISKTSGAEAFRIDKFTHEKKTQARKAELDRDHGLSIRMKNLKPIVYKRSCDITSHIIKPLGARYKYYLMSCFDYLNKTDGTMRQYNSPIEIPKRKRLSLTFQMINLDNGESMGSWDVEPQLPIYWNEQSQTEEPIIKSKEFKGDNWRAVMQLGWCPKQKQLSKMGKTLSKDFPYGSSKPGLEVYMHGRVIEDRLMADMGVDVRSINSFMAPRGEVHLLQGFDATAIKCKIKRDQNFEELKGQIKEFLDDSKFYQLAPKNSESEDVICKRIKALLSAGSLSGNDVIEEQVTAFGNTSCKVDLLRTIDGQKAIVYETKIVTAEPLDVMQTYMYVFLSNGQWSETAFLIAPDFTQGAVEIAKEIKDRLGVTIILKRLSEFGIEI